MKHRFKELQAAAILLLGMAPPALAQDQGASALVNQPTAAEIAAPTGDERQPVVQGTLANGLTYAILSRRGKDTGVGILMRVRGGFLAERRPGERGLAHLIEHLVFLSPTEAAPDQYRRFRQIGFPLTLPDPAGGTTSWRESDYFVVSKTNNPADLASLAGLFREVANGLTFRADSVENARADVLREMADKKLGNDIFARYVAAVAPGSPTDLIDAQNSDDVPHASIDTIRAFYRRVYRPENSTFVIVGDIDPTAMATMLREHFGSWRGAGPTTPPLPVPKPKLDTTAPISSSALPYGRNTVLLTSTAPMERSPITDREQTTAAFMDMLVMRAANRRMAEQYADYPQGKSGFFIDDGAQGFRQMMFWDEFVPGRWREATTRLVRLGCGVAARGFSDDETRQTIDMVLNDLMSREATAADAPNAWLAKELADATTAQRELVSPTDMLKQAKAVFANVDASALNKWWSDRWSAGRRHLRVETSALRPNDQTIGQIDEVARSAGLDRACTQ